MLTCQSNVHFEKKYKMSNYYQIHIIPFHNATIYTDIVVSSIIFEYVGVHDGLNFLDTNAS